MGVGAVSAPAFFRSGCNAAMQTNQTSVLVNGDIEMITADPKPFAAIASKIAELEPGADAAELTELLVDASIELAAQLKAA